MRVYRAISEYNRQKGYSPSVRDLSEMLNVSPASVHRQILNLKRIGWVTGEPHKPRTLKIKKEKDRRDMMKLEELKQAMREVKIQIEALKAEVEAAIDLTEKRKLEHQLLDLRVLQLWQMEQYENLGGKLSDIKK